MNFVWRHISGKLVVLRAALLAVATLAAATAAQAQTSGADQAGFEALQARRAQLFRATLDNPGNLDIAFEYAMLSAQLGDHEAAISTLERMLVYSPGLPRVQLELAVLYYRIGAPETAKLHLDAVRSRNLPPAVRAKVDEFSIALDEAVKPYRFSASIDFGVQSYSNANFATDRASIIIGGVPVTLGPGARAQSDTSVFALGQFNYVHKLSGQGTLLEADATLYAAKFSDLGRLDLNYLELAIGPSFNLGPAGWDKARLGVYAIAGASTLGGSKYSSFGGAGMRLRAQLAERTTMEALIEGRSLSYSNSSLYPTASLQDGDTWRARVQVIRSFSPAWTGSAAVEARQVNGQNGYNSFSGYGVSVKANYAFRGPTQGVLADNAPWSLTLAAGGLARDYDGPDPIINPLAAEEDSGYWLEASLGVPLENNFSAYLTGQYFEQDSNYPTREYDGVTVTFGIRKRF